MKFNKIENHSIKLAKDVAMTAHLGQEYDPGESYFDFHISKVAEVLILSDINVDRLAILIQIAYLHDIVEDTDYTLLNLSNIFPLAVVEGVDLCTDGNGKNRKEKKNNFYRKYKNFSIDLYYGATVKTADRIVNLRKSISTNSKHLKKYISEHDEFRNIVVPHADHFIKRIYDDLLKDIK